MRAEGKRLKTIVYWVLLIGYLVGIYYVWLDFKEELREAKNAKEFIEIQK
jgi:hypothetical protein